MRGLTSLTQMKVNGLSEMKSSTMKALPIDTAEKRYFSNESKVPIFTGNHSKDI